MEEPQTGPKVPALVSDLLITVISAIITQAEDAKAKVRQDLP